MAFKKGSNTQIKGTPKFKDTDEVEFKLQSKQKERRQDTEIKKAVQAKQACVDIFEDINIDND